MWLSSTWVIPLGSFHLHQRCSSLMKCYEEGEQRIEVRHHFLQLADCLFSFAFHTQIFRISTLHWQPSDILIEISNDVQVLFRLWESSRSFWLLTWTSNDPSQRCAEFPSPFPNSGFRPSLPFRSMFRSLLGRKTEGKWWLITHCFALPSSTSWT